jgi:hypothetical protein
MKKDYFAQNNIPYCAPHTFALWLKSSTLNGKPIKIKSLINEENKNDDDSDYKNIDKMDE